MGQQQLLLLVLSTVIVGLATVAGIQAFSENQAQATQDALVQRGTSLASDLQGALAKPAQLGGVDSSSTGSKAASAIGLDNATVDVDGASGQDATCTINSATQITCTASESPQNVRVNLQGDSLATNFSTDGFD
ncbi:MULTISPECIES: hypothetical protein [Salinibacter]|uniref:hypothetical protein n=1 Tax=Salinibacter TaxID=146918 RepID=UPI0021E7D1DB|nr:MULTISPECIES: hypothetical protein [Salinibacter]